MQILPALLRRMFALPQLRKIAHRRFVSMKRAESLPKENSPRTLLKVLVLGVYMADRPNTAEHLVETIASEPGLEVEHRWASLKGVTENAHLAAVTRLNAQQPAPKFALINRLIGETNLGSFDYVVVVDDDIFVRPGFLGTFLYHQQSLGFAIAQPARAWHSHFDHGLVMRRPWYSARQTRFVECGPLVSFSREAVSLLLPFDAESEMWGMDLVWPVAIERAGLKLGIVDAISVDHSLRGQATTYDRSTELEAMSAYLARTPHLSGDVFEVLKRHPAAWRTRYF